MKFYLVPANKLRLAEDQAGKTAQEEKRSWAKIAEQFKSTSLRETTSDHINILKELGCVSLRNGIVLLNGDLQSAIGARQLVKNLSDSGPILPAVDRFLRRLKEIEPSTPEAI
jgi:hypothetical protein